MNQHDAPPPPPTPAPPAPLRVPQTDDPDVAASIKRKMIETFGNKRGREAANLTGNSTTSDSGSFSRTTLG